MTDPRVFALIESVVRLLELAPRDTQAVDRLRWLGDSMSCQTEWPGGGQLQIRMGRDLPPGDRRDGYQSCWGVRVDWHSPIPEQSVRWEAYRDDDNEHTLLTTVSCQLAESGWPRSPSPAPGGVRVDTGPEYLRGDYGPRFQIRELAVYRGQGVSSREAPFCLADRSWQPDWGIPRTTSLWTQMVTPPSRESMTELAARCPGLMQYRPTSQLVTYYRQPDDTWSTAHPPDGVVDLWVHGLSDIPLADGASRILIDQEYVSALAQRYRDTHYLVPSHSRWCLFTRRPRQKSARTAEVSVDL